jgi:single-stranded DNA-binding protein
VNSTGVKQYRTEIIAESLQLGPKGAGGTSGGSSYPKSSAQNLETEQQSKQEEIPVIEENYTPPSNDGATDEIDVKDIPF